MKKLIKLTVAFTFIYIMTFVTVTTIQSNAISPVNLTPCPSTIGSNDKGCMAGTVLCPSNGSYISIGSACGSYIYCSTKNNYYYTQYDYDNDCNSRRYCSLNMATYNTQYDYDTYCKDTQNINKTWCAYRNQYINNWENCTSICTATQTWDSNTNKCIENMRWCPNSRSYIKQWELCTNTTSPITVDINTGNVTYPNNNPNIIYSNNNQNNNSNNSNNNINNNRSNSNQDRNISTRIIYVNPTDEETYTKPISYRQNNTIIKSTDYVSYDNTGSDTDNNIHHIDNRHDDAEDSFWNNNTEDTKVMIRTSNRNLVKTSINNKEITNNTSNNIGNAPIFLSQQNMPQNMPQQNIQQQPISPQMMNNAINNKSSSTKKSSILPSTGKDWLMFIVVLLGLILIGKYGYDKHLKAKAEHH